MGKLFSQPKLELNHDFILEKLLRTYADYNELKTKIQQIIATYRRTNNMNNFEQNRARA